jgi:hypothetical protein
MSADDHLHPAQFSYQDGHRPGGPDYGAPMHDVENMMPDYHEMPHVYGHRLNPSAHPAGSLEREYVTHHNRAVEESHAAITQARGNPDADIKVFRAGPTKEINPGDWVTPSRAYADIHKESNGQPGWHVAARTVKAKHLFTEGEANEWGWHPE